MKRAQLAELTRAEQALAQAETVGEVKQIFDLAEAYRTYASTRAEQNRAATIKLRAAAKGGQMLAQIPKKVGGRKVTDSLSATLGIESDTAAQQLSSRWQRIAEIEADGKLDGYIDKTTKRINDDVEISMAGLFHYAKTGTVVDTTMSSTSFECYTPANYVDAARVVLGGIDLDPASSDEANETVQADRYYTEDDNGLDHDWDGRVWLNPPYGRSLTADFVTKLVDEHTAGRVTAGIVLLNAYGFDARWFQPLFDHVLCFTDHRIPFYGGGPTFGSLFAYLGDDRPAFIREFSEFGNVVGRVQ